MRLARLTAPGASVSVVADSSILDQNAAGTNITALAAMLRAGGSIGTAADGIETDLGTLAASANSQAGLVFAPSPGDGIYIQNSGPLTVDAVPAVSVTRVVHTLVTAVTPCGVLAQDQSFGTQAVTDAILSDVRTQGNDGNIVLATTAGDLIVNEGVANPADSDGGVVADGGGNILLDANRARLTPDTGDILVNAAVRSGSGNISLLADDDVLQQDDGDATARQNGNLQTGFNGTLDVWAANAWHDGANDGIAMSRYVWSQTAQGNIHYQADNAANQGDIRVAAIRSVGAPQGHVSLVAAGSILDSNDPPLPAPAVGNITGDHVRLLAGGSIGISTNAVEIAANQLAAEANSTAALPVLPAVRDGIYLREQDGLTVTAIAPFAVNRVQADGTPIATADPAPLAGLRTLGNDGNVVLVSDAGSLVLDEVVTAHTGGNVLLQTLADDGDITVLDPVSSVTGHISILSRDDVAQQQTGNLTTGGTIDVWAENRTVADAGGGIVMEAGIVSQAGGNIRYQVDNGGDLRLAQLNTPADIALNVAGNVLDNNGDTLNFVANEVRITAGGSIGTAADALESNIDELVAVANNTAVPLPNPPAARDGIYWFESGNDLTIDTVAPVAANRVAADGTTAAVQDAAALSGVQTVAINRDVTVRGNGNIATLAAGDVVTRGGNIRICFTGSGSISGDLRSGGDPATVPGGLIQVFTQQGLTIAAVVSSELPLSPGAGALYLGPGVTFTPAAVVGVGDQNVVLDGGGLDQIISTSVTFPFHTVLYARRDVIVDNAAVSTTAGNDLVIEADMDNALNAGEGTFGGVLVRGAGGSVSSGGDLAISGTQLYAGGLAPWNGQAVYLNAAGNTATAAGDLVIQGKTQVATADVVLNGNVQATTGNLTVLAQDDVRQNANIVTLGNPATIDVLARNRDHAAAGDDGLIMAAGTLAQTTAGNIRYAAENRGDVWLSRLNAGAALVSVNAAGSVLDSDPGQVAITAAAAMLRAGGSIGRAAQHVDTAVTTLAAAGQYRRGPRAGPRRRRRHLPRQPPVADRRRRRAGGRPAGAARHQRRVHPVRPGRVLPYVLEPAGDGRPAQRCPHRFQRRQHRAAGRWQPDGVRGPGRGRRRRRRRRGPRSRQCPAGRQWPEDGRCHAAGGSPDDDRPHQRPGGRTTSSSWTTAMPCPARTATSARAAPAPSTCGPRTAPRTPAPTASSWRGTSARRPSRGISATWPKTTGTCGRQPSARWVAAEAAAGLGQPGRRRIGDRQQRRPGTGDAECRGRAGENPGRRGDRHQQRHPGDRCRDAGGGEQHRSGPARTARGPRRHLPARTRRRDGRRRRPRRRPTRAGHRHHAGRGRRRRAERPADPGQPRQHRAGGCCRRPDRARRRGQPARPGRRDRGRAATATSCSRPTAMGLRPTRATSSCVRPSAPTGTSASWPRTTCCNATTATPRSGRTATSRRAARSTCWPRTGGTAMRPSGASGWTPSRSARPAGTSATRPAGTATWSWRV